MSLFRFFILFTFGISPGSFFNEDGVLWPTIEAINRFEHIFFPIDDVAALSTISDGFNWLSRGRIFGCVMAIDGLAVETRQPFPAEVDGNVMSYKLLLKRKA